MSVDRSARVQGTLQMARLHRGFALRIGVVLALLASAITVPAVGSAAPLPCYYPTPGTVSDSANHFGGLTVTVSYNYKTCVATVTIDNLHSWTAYDVGGSLWERAGACDGSAPNGNRLWLWSAQEMPGYPNPGWRKKFSIAQNPGRCFRGYSRVGGAVDGEDVYAPDYPLWRT
jgi:hypothetical protein